MCLHNNTHVWFVAVYVSNMSDSLSGDFHLIKFEKRELEALKRLIRKLNTTPGRFILYPEKGKFHKRIRFNQHFLAKICFCTWILKLTGNVYAL